MAIQVTFRCGHTATVGATASEARCPRCGNRRVAQSVAPAPHIRGTASGPHVETMNLDAITVDLTTRT